MQAMVLMRKGAGVLTRCERAVPTPSREQVLVRVRACAVCRTDLHVVDGELADPAIPIVPGPCPAEKDSDGLSLVPSRFRGQS